MTPATLDAAYPDRSPDGTEILFTSDHVAEGQFELYVLKLGDTRVHRLTRTIDSEFGTSWQPCPVS